MCVLRAVIQFLTAKNTSEVEIHTQLMEIYSSDIMSIQMVRKGCGEFWEGRCKVYHESRTGSLKVVMDKSVNTLCMLLYDDHPLTFQEPEMIMNNDLRDPLSQMSISRIVMEKLGFCKVRARGVPTHEGFRISYRRNTKRIAWLPHLIFWTNTNVTVKKCWVGLLCMMRHGCITSPPPPKRSRCFWKNQRTVAEKNSTLFCR